MSDTLLNNVEGYQGLVGLFAAIVTGLCVLVTTCIAIYATAMSTPIEVALMKKGEQYKYYLSKFAVLGAAISLMFVCVGALSHSTYYEKNKNAVTQSQIDEEETDVFEEVKGTETERKNGEVSAKNEEKQLDGLSAMFICTGGFGLICVLFAQGTIKIFDKINLIRNRTISVIRQEGLNATIIVSYCFITLILAAIDINLMLGGILLGSVLCAVYARKVINSCFEEDLKIAMYTCSFLLAMGINNWFVWGIAEELSADEYVRRALISIVLALMVTMFVMCSLGAGKPMGAKVMYYDLKKGKRLFLYFRHDDNYFIAGETATIHDCETYYFVKVEDVMGTSLEKVSSRERGYEKTYAENVVLQVGEEYLLSELLEKIVSVLKEKGVGAMEYSKTMIYIKPEDRKMYFVVPNTAIPPNEQFVEL